jgi:hypothetical protein
VSTRKLIEPVGLPLNSEETVAVSDVNEIVAGARETLSVPGAKTKL